MKKKLVVLTVASTLFASQLSYATDTTQTDQVNESKTVSENKDASKEKVSNNAMSLFALGATNDSASQFLNPSSLLYIDPQTSERYLQNNLVSVQLDDGLVFNFNLNLVIKTDGTYGIGFQPVFKTTSGSSYEVTRLQTTQGDTTSLISAKSNHIGYSRDHYYRTAGTIYAPDGTSYIRSNDFVTQINSPHKISWIKYSLSSVGTNHAKLNNAATKITLSNGYGLSFHYSAKDLIGDCSQTSCHGGGQHKECVTKHYSCYKGTYIALSSINDNKGHTWKVSNSAAGDSPGYHEATTVTLPNKQSLQYKSSYVKGFNGITSYQSNSTITHKGASIQVPVVDKLTSSGNTKTITHTNGSKDVYEFLASSNGSGNDKNNHQGIYKSHKIIDAKGTVMYDEENTWKDIKGVATLTKQAVTQDGITSTKEYADYNEYLYPQTITTTASNGEKAITKATYFVLNANGLHMVKPKTITTTDANGKVLQSVDNIYDAKGYLTQSTVNGITTKYTYDAKGNLATKTDANGHVTKYSDYISGKPKTVTDPMGSITKYTYDYRGEVLTETDPKGKVTKYTYDNIGQLSSVNPPIGNATTTTYSNDGRTITLKNGNKTTVNNYNGLGNLLNTTISDGVPADTISQVFKTDSKTNRSFKSYPCNKTSECKLGDIYTYDVLDRPISLVKNTSSF
jgi:YD repeat-containing protein